MPPNAEDARQEMRDDMRASNADAHAMPHAHFSTRRDGYRIEPEGSEPCFSGLDPATPPSPSHDELQRQYAFYDRFNSPPARPRLRLVYVLAIFAIGAAIGLASGWLFPSPATNDFDNDISHVSTGVAMPVVRGSGTVLRGIDPHELPYDGVPQDANVQIARTPSQETSSKEVSSGDSSSGTSGTRMGAASKAKDESKKNRVVAKQRSQRAPESASAADKAKDEKKVPRKHRSARHVTKDREIERIKQQAADELKKKTENRRSVEHGGAVHRSIRQLDVPSKIDKATRTRAMLARCQHAGNFFLREKCKWQICSGRWGKNGCPSYQTQASTY